MAKLGKFFKGGLVSDNLILIASLLLLMMTVLYCETYIIRNMEHFADVDTAVSGSKEEEGAVSGMSTMQPNTALGTQGQNSDVGSNVVSNAVTSAAGASNVAAPTTTLNVPMMSPPQFPVEDVKGAGGSDASTYPPCPPCGRCPEPAFECKKVPTYVNLNFTNKLPNQ